MIMEEILKKLEMIELQYNRLGHQLIAIKEVLDEIEKVKDNEDMVSNKK